MPRGDRTGPAGEGPKTGRGMGRCAGNKNPGFVNRPGKMSPFDIVREYIGQIGNERSNGLLKSNGLSKSNNRDHMNYSSITRGKGSGR